MNSCEYSEDRGFKPMEPGTDYILKRDYISVPREEFIEILDKASRFDVLVNDMKRNIDIDPNQYGIIDDRVVYAVTGCASYREEVRKLKAKEKEE